MNFIMGDRPAYFVLRWPLKEFFTFLLLNFDLLFVFFIAKVILSDFIFIVLTTLI